MSTSRLIGVALCSLVSLCHVGVTHPLRNYSPRWSSGFLQFLHHNKAGQVEAVDQTDGKNVPSQESNDQMQNQRTNGKEATLRDIDMHKCMALGKYANDDRALSILGYDNEAVEKCALHAAMDAQAEMASKAHAEADLKAETAARAHQSALDQRGAGEDGDDDGPIKEKANEAAIAHGEALNKAHLEFAAQKKAQVAASEEAAARKHNLEKNRKRYRNARYNSEK